MTDVACGREIEITNSQIRFIGHRMISHEAVGETTVAEMSFNSAKEAEEWALEQKAKGIDVQLIEQGQKTRYHVGTAHAQIKLGGDKEGLRAIGYVAQTFLAHSFPNIARALELQGIKDYTLKNVGSGFVWWDFDPPDDLPPNKFPFGHRVIVGLNKNDGTAYARISFFSTLNFAVLFGPVPFEASGSVITDIDPLAKSPPNDLFSWTEGAAKGVVSKSDDMSASLAEAISSGKTQERINDLMRRIVDFERQTAAKEIMGRKGRQRSQKAIAIDCSLISYRRKLSEYLRSCDTWRTISGNGRRPPSNELYPSISIKRSHSTPPPHWSYRGSWQIPCHRL
jgi:hypothetical protein